MLKINTGRTPTGNHAEISVFVKHGQEWKDVEVELDFNEFGSGQVYPGPFLRVHDTRIESTTAWWFEYATGQKGCTMRPFKNNHDGSWLYTRHLTAKLSSKTWYHAKYRVVGDRFVY